LVERLQIRQEEVGLLERAHYTVRQRGRLGAAAVAEELQRLRESESEYEEILEGQLQQGVG
jgi:hypothetical protein